jgi:hypothetical protein
MGGYPRFLAHTMAEEGVRVKTSPPMLPCGRKCET